MNTKSNQSFLNKDLEEQRDVIEVTISQKSNSSSLGLFYWYYMQVIYADTRQ